MLFRTQFTGFDAKSAQLDFVAKSNFDGAGTTASESPSLDSISADNSTTAVLAVGGSESGYIQTKTDADWFKVTLTEGQTYDFTIKGADGTDLIHDASLVLYSFYSQFLVRGSESAFDTASVITYTATTTGTYYISAQLITGATSSGGYTISLSNPYVPTVDGDDDSFATTATLSLGQTVNGVIDAPGDRDWYAVTLTAGQGYAFDLINQGDGTFQDPILYFYDQTGQLLARDDDGGVNHNSHLIVAPPTSGTYYIAAGAFSDGQHGSYNLSVKSVPPPLLTESIDWGTKLNVSSGVVKVYFAGAGESYDGETSLGWTAYEIQQAMAALSVYSHYIPLTFVQTSNIAEATFKLLTANDLGDGVLAYMNPPGEDNAGVGVFARNANGWSQTVNTVMEPGGLGFDTLVHEFGHGLGLAHPFDNGGASTVMMGVTDTHDYQGLGYQNQGVYTVMSYNDGWPSGQLPQPNIYSRGYSATPMAIDVAVLQAKYGVNSGYRSGNDTYYLDSSSAWSSYVSLWDTGGVDLISAEQVYASVKATIDLRPADMGYGTTVGYAFDTVPETVSGGAVSFAGSTSGGMTIDAGVQIENANGHAGVDIIVGNTLNNVIRGLGGSDSIYAQAGNDQIYLLMMPDANDTDYVDGGAGNDTLTLDFTRNLVSKGTFDNGVLTLTITGHGTLAIANVETVAFTDGAYAATQVINVAPHLGGALKGTVDSAGQHQLTAAELSASDFNGDALTFYVQAAGKLGTADFTGATTHGYVAVDGVQVNTFTLAQLNGGHVSFVQDGVLDAPAGFTVAAFDGNLFTTAVAFNFVTINNHGDHYLVTGLGSAELVYDSIVATPLPLILAGYAGDDTYVVTRSQVSVLEQAGEGTDLVRSSVSYVLDPNVENGELTDGGNVGLTGNAAANRLSGNAGNNLLNGLAGDDIMVGGAGDDTYFVDSTGDVAAEVYGDSATATDPGGHDTVYASVSAYLGRWMETLILTGTAASGGGNDLDNVITGNGANNTLNGYAGNDVLDGGAGADVMIGALGDDTFYVDNAGDKVIESLDQGTDVVFASVSFTLSAGIETLILTGNGNINASGNAQDNTLVGTSGNNVLDGGAGADSMTGGAGDDTYVVNSTGDVVTELAGEGTDAVISGINYTLGATLENLTLTGSAKNGTGNGLANLMTGNAVDNTLSGGAGDDVLDGGAGIDTLIGGTGNDTYYVDHANDVVTEAGNAGIDLVMSSANWTMAANVENLTLIGSAIVGQGNALDNVITGSNNNNSIGGDEGNDRLFGLAGDDALGGGNGDDVLDGGTGADIMGGGAGNDTYYVDNAADNVSEWPDQGVDTIFASVSYSVATTYVENITLTGSLFLSATGNGMNNVLTGNSGNNILNGNVGADTMIGGAGSDYYYVDNVGDVVTELAGQGTDMVYALISYTLGANVENVTLLGTGNLDATGNELNNFLFGTSGNNTLNAGAGADYIFALGGNDVLDGGTGADGMYGGAGNDTYYVDNFADLCNEQSTGTGIDDGGVDIVISSANFQLSGFIENLTLTGTAVVGAGNASNNIILGNASGNYLFGLDGADTLNGGAGGDALYGGAGADTFVFSTGSGFDVIGDFSAAENDKIDLHAYANGVVNGAGIVISASGSSTYVNMGGGNVIFVANASVSDVSSHIVW